ncbi:MAG: hypothetical protein WCA13_02800 [Terriglobales bacterium]
MKPKSLAVITLFVLGCSAAFAQGSATLGFATPGDLTLDCDYEQIQWGGSNNFYMQGTDVLTTCGLPINATIEGVKVSITPADGTPVLTGPAYAYADNVYDAESESYTGDQWLVITQTTPSKLLRHYGWVGYVGFSGLEFIANYGYLSASIPGAAGNKKPTQGSPSAPAVGGSRPTLTRTIK